MASKYPYQTEVWHKELGKYKIIKAQTSYELQQKVNAQKEQWKEQWCKKVEQEQRNKNQEEGLKYAIKLTLEAEKTQNEIERILFNSLNPIKLNFLSLKDCTEYPVKKPMCKKLETLPKEPLVLDLKYNTKPSFFCKVIQK